MYCATVSALILPMMRANRPSATSFLSASCLDVARHAFTSDVANLLETNTDPTNPNDRFGLNTASQPWIQNIAQIERSESSMLFRDKAMSAKLNLKPETWNHRLRYTQTWHVVSSDLTRPSFGQKGGLAEWGPNQFPMSSESAPWHCRLIELETCTNGLFYPLAELNQCIFNSANRLII